jgi:hypothetical protein
MNLYCGILDHVQAPMLALNLAGCGVKVPVQIQEAQLDSSALAGCSANGH